MLPSVTEVSSLTKTVMMSVAVSKVGVVFVEPEVQCEWTLDSIGGVSHYLKNVSCY